MYETPILKSRTPDSTPKEAEIGQARSAQVTNLSRVSMNMDLKSALAPHYLSQLRASARSHNPKKLSSA